MPTIRFLRDMNGAEELFKQGKCWAAAVIWVYNEGHETLEDLPRQTQCGYCMACSSSSLKETEK